MYAGLWALVFAQTLRPSSGSSRLEDSQTTSSTRWIGIWSRRTVALCFFLVGSNSRHRNSQEFDFHVQGVADCPIIRRVLCDIRCWHVHGNADIV